MNEVTDAELEAAVRLLEGAGWRIVTSARTLAREDLRKLLARFRQDAAQHQAKLLQELRAENKLLDEIANRARAALLVSIKGTPGELGAALGSLSLACKAHYDWRTEKVKAAQ